MTYDQLKESHNSQTKRANPKHYESELQRACVTWFRLQYPNQVLFAIPNGGFRKGREAGILKAEGVLSGVADLFLMLASKEYHGLFIEMKYGAGKQSQAQISFQAQTHTTGYKYVVITSLEGFINEVNTYIR